MIHASTHSRRTWWERLSERCFRASMPQLVRDMARESPHLFDELLRDLEAPLEAVFEQAVAHRLGEGGYPAFMPAETLMPVMAQRLGMTEASLFEAHADAELRATCNRCPAVGRCWRALRHGIEADECRGFCPNAEALARGQLAC